jgi:hypothetical protein
MFIKPPNIISSNIKAVFTTKTLANRHMKEVLAKEFNISKRSIYFPIQRHTNKVHVLELNLEPVIADAVLTNKKGILIGVQVADCVPILLYDEQKSIIGVVHAGWRGTAQQILRNTIKTLQEKFHSSTENIFIALGPSIKQCCYNVHSNVKIAVQEATGEGAYYYKKDGKWFIDLSLANKIQALSLGIPEQNIWQSKECTFCNPDKFYSYRYSKDSVGKQGGFIGIL